VTTALQKLELLQNVVNINVKLAAQH